ncbi:WxL protein peptidoglycan domain-containing protein [Agromyces sp. MMS24-JH15]|uniref:WxL protein peptidoglycan domain-containing protein n=1 Tax=Agromyces sp. MMS24-JH15 TaxID=3243765 RepID=UPI0037498757
MPARSQLRPRGIRALALAAAAVALASPTAPAFAADDPVSDPAVWGVRTASNDLGAAREHYAYALDPGETLHDAIVVANHDSTPLDLDVYAADGFTTEAGELDLLMRGETSTSVGAWIALDEGTVHLEPGASVEVPFTVTVPESASPGDYAGGVVTSLATPEQQQGIAVDRRLGIRVHLRVGGDLAPALAVEDLRVDYTGTLDPFGTGEAVVTYTVRNTGNLRLSATQAASVAGPGGLFPVAAAGLGDLPELLPGDEREVRVPIAGVFPAGLVTADVVLQPIVPQTVDASDAAVAVDAVRAQATTWAVSWTLLGLVLLVVAAAVLPFVLRGRRRRREDARVAAAVAEALAARDEERAGTAVER